MGGVRAGRDYDRVSAVTRDSTVSMTENTEDYRLGEAAHLNVVCSAEQPAA